MKYGIVIPENLNMSKTLLLKDTNRNAGVCRHGGKSVQRLRRLSRK